MIFKTAWWGTILLLLQFAHEDEGSELLFKTQGSWV